MTEIEKVKIYLSNENAKIPTQAYKNDVGYDIYAVEDYTVPFGAVVEIKTGVHLILPTGLFAQINTRSNAGKQGFYVHHGVIDPDFTGEITIFFFNVCATVDNNGMVKKEEKTIKKGEKVAQILFHRAEYPKFEQTTTLPETERGEKGFGSSGL